MVKVIRDILAFWVCLLHCKEGGFLLSKIRGLDEDQKELCKFTKNHALRKYFPSFHTSNELGSFLFLCLGSFDLFLVSSLPRNTAAGTSSNASHFAVTFFCPLGDLDPSSIYAAYLWSVYFFSRALIKC